MLGLISHTSDYFEELYQYCIKMLKEGNVYADDTEQEAMRDERMNGIASKRSNASTEDNLANFEEMKAGSDDGIKWCI